MYIEGKGYLNIQIGNFSNFLDLENELVQFRVTHNCGVAGTLFEILFKTRNKALADCFIQNNPLHISYGINPTQTHEYDAWITEVKREEDTQGYIKIGFGAVPFVELFTDRTAWSFYGSSYAALYTYLHEKMSSSQDDVPFVCFDYDRVESTAKKWNEIAKANLDIQTWSKNQVTMAQFLLELWLHMNIEDDIPLMAFMRKSPRTILLNTVNMCKEAKIDEIYQFIPEGLDTDMNNVIRYSGQFDTKSYKFTTGYATGYDTAVYINNLEGGKDSVFVPGKEVTLATGKKAERKFTGYRVMDNKYQNENTHGKYQECYYRNYYKLVDLSSIVGGLLVMGDIPEGLELVTPVYVNSLDNRTDGRWIVNTIQSVFSQTVPYQTTVYVCRDNYNRIEDSEIDADKNDDHEVINISNQQVADALQSVRNLRLAVARTQRLLDGTTKGELQGYCQSVKYSFLTMFRVNGRQVDLTSRLGMMRTLIVMGNDIMNSLVDKLFPYPYNMLLHDFLINKPTLITLLSQLLQTVLPEQYRSLWSEILTLLAEINLLMSMIFKKNSKRVSAEVVSSGSNVSKVLQFKEDADGEYEFDDSSSINDEDNNMPVDRTEENTEKINEITDEFIENTEGLDIPIPDITLDDSESLLPIDDLKEVIAERVEDYLRGQGYLAGVLPADFVSILRGRKQLDFNTIKLINGNIGNMLYARFWGTYSGELNKLGRIIDISNKVITVSHVDLLDEVFKGDQVVVSGIPRSNGTYTVLDVSKIIDGSDVYTRVKVLEDITSYTDTPLKHTTPLCNVSKITTGHSLDGINNLTAIHIPGKVTKNQVQKFLAPDLPIYVTNAGQDTSCTIFKSDYDIEAKETIVYTRLVMEPIENDNMVLQVVFESESKTALSKLSNHTFTEFYIKNSFKDIYATVPCTKIVSALRGTKIWVALPYTEENLSFYLNNEIAEMDIISDVDLGLYNAGGAPLHYTVYMSKETFNSNNVVLEIRKNKNS